MRFVVAVVLSVATVVTGQTIGLGPEISSDPLVPNDRVLTAPIALAHDDQGTVIAWLAGDATRSARIFAARLDATNHATGVVREMPVLSNNVPLVDATSPAVAVLSGRVLVAWTELAPGTSPYNLPILQTVAFAIFDGHLNPITSGTLTPSILPSRMIARAGADRFWIAAHDQLWWIMPDGTHSDGIGFGRIADDMTISGWQPQIAARRVAVVDNPSCSCDPGPHAWGCPDSCVVHNYVTNAFLYALTLLGPVDEQLWPDLNPALPVALRANNGKDILVVWFTRNGTLLGMRVPPSLPIRAQVQELVGTYVGSPSRADIATDGERYMVVWDTYPYDGPRDIAGASLESDGRIYRFSIAISTEDEHDPSIVAIGSGTFLVAYRKSDPITRTERIAGRVVTVLKPRGRTVR